MKAKEHRIADPFAICHLPFAKIVKYPKEYFTRRITKRSGFSEKFRQAPSNYFIWITCLLMILETQKSGAQSEWLGHIPASCQEIQEPHFAGGPTLCDQNTSFTPDYTIADGTLASNLSLTLWPENVTAFAAKKILVQGVFYLNISVAFRDCIVKLAPGAQIIVGNPGSIVSTEFLSFRTKYFSCESMWKGIVIKDGTKTRVLNSTFEDAQYALTVGRHVPLFLFNNTFNRNFVSITNDKLTTSMPIQLFAKNKFDCTSALYDFYDLDFSSSGEIAPVTFAGILLKSCASNIGYFGAENVFKNIVYGIVARNSIINVKGCIFSDAQLGVIIPNVIPEIGAESNGIVTNGGELFVIGSDGNVSCNFYSNAGVLTSGSDCYITYADFEEASVTCGSNYAGQSIYIQDNIFNAYEGVSKIFVERSMASGTEYHTYITGNKLLYESEVVYGPLIYIYGINDAKYGALVAYNNLSFDVARTTGISAYISKSDYLLIMDNVINFTNEFGCRGINVSDGITEGTEVSFNTINGVFANTSAKTTGIKADMIRGPMYCANAISLVGYGLQFTGNCDNSHITFNTLGIDDENSLGVGLHVDDSHSGDPGVIGVQRGTRNMFLNPSSLYLDNLAALFESSGDIVLSQYLITTADASDPIYNPNPLNIDPSTGWFKVQGDENNLCNDGSILSITANDSLMINSDTVFEQLSGPVKFHSEKNLIAMLLGNNEWTEDYQGYLASKVGTPEYVIGKTEQNLKKAYQMDLSAQENLDSLLSLQHYEYDRILTYDAYNYAQVDTVTFSFGIGQDSLMATLERISDLTEHKTDMREERMDALIVALAEIEDSLEAFTPLAVYDSYYKKIYMLRIKQISDGFLDSLDYDILYEIAQDNTDSSYANTTAYAMFNLCAEAQDLEDKKNQANFEQLSANNIEIIPAETTPPILNENFVIDQSEIVYLYDISGRLVMSFIRTSFEGELSQFSTLAPGVYYQVIVDSLGKGISSGLIPIFRL